jgi:6-phosphogluconolactonase
VLGLGDDGHVASLFPGSRLIAERRRRVAAVRDAPRPPALRLTITPPVIERAGRVLVLATGAGKAQALANALAPGDPAAVPARLARDREWYVDRAAARSGPDPGGTAARG